MVSVTNGSRLTNCPPDCPGAQRWNGHACVNPAIPPNNPGQSVHSKPIAEDCGDDYVETGSGVRPGDPGTLRPRSGGRQTDFTSIAGALRNLWERRENIYGCLSTGEATGVVTGAVTAAPSLGFGFLPGYVFGFGAGCIAGYNTPLAHP